MAQSTLYKRGSAIATDVNVTDDSSRALGRVDVDSLPSGIEYDLINDSSREVGNVQVTNTVDTDLETLPVVNVGQTATSEGTPAPLNGGASITVPDSGVLRVKNPEGTADTVYVGDDTVDTTTGYALDPGEEVPVPVDDVSKVHVESASDITVTWMVLTN